MEGVIGLMIPLTVVATFGIWVISKTSLGHALADRLRGQAAPANDPEVAELRRQVDEMRLELGEVQERLDFAERLLAQRTEPARIEKA